MKTFLTCIAALALIAAGYYGLKPSGQQPNSQRLIALPWDIQVSGSQQSRVFGVWLGQATLHDAMGVWGPEHEIAVISDQQDHASLEGYYNHFQAGPLQGRLVFRLQADDDEILAMQENAAHSEYMASGARKFLLNPAHLQDAQTRLIRGITYLPKVQLDESIIEQRFGQPNDKITRKGEIHYLYPERGLHIVVFEQSRDLLQYVAPKDFEPLILRPLQRAVPAPDPDTLD